MNPKTNKASLGFTLIELLVVISIIGLLSSVILVAFNQTRSVSRDALRAGNLRQLATAIELYSANNGYYPVTCPNNSAGHYSHCWACWNCSNGPGVLTPDYERDITDPQGTKVAEDIRDALKPFMATELKDPYDRPTDPGNDSSRGYWYMSDGRDFKVGMYINQENLAWYQKNGIMIDYAWCTPVNNDPLQCDYDYGGVGFWTPGAASW